jgi:hypothetical protein
VIKKKVIDKQHDHNAGVHPADQRTLDSTQPSTYVSSTISGKWMLAVSVFVGLHLLAVLAEPLRFFSRSPVKYASEEARLLRMATGPYVDFMYLSHGYSFFAPNPGPSHLLECEVNSDSKWRVFPDRKDDWPRLLYHRFFMLSEFYNTQFAPATLAEQDKLDQDTLSQWKQDREQYEQLQASIRTNLAKDNPDHQATLRRIEHILPSEYQILVERWKLTDPRLYVELSEGDAPAPTQVPPESLPQP